MPERWIAETTGVRAETERQAERTRVVEVLPDSAEGK